MNREGYTKDGGYTIYGTFFLSARVLRGPSLKLFLQYSIRPNSVCPASAGNGKGAQPLR